MRHARGSWRNISSAACKIIWDDDSVIDIYISLSLYPHPAATGTKLGAQFVVEAIGFVAPAGFVVASQHKDVVWPRSLPRAQLQEHLNGSAATVDIVTWGGGLHASRVNHRFCTVEYVDDAVRGLWEGPQDVLHVVKLSVHVAHDVHDIVVAG